MRKLLILIVAFALLAAGYVYLKPKTYLIAAGVVPVYSTLDEAMKSPTPQPMFKLSPGQRVRVISTVDVKHYQIYLIGVPDGQQGYVLEGEYRLEH